jgi:hypothetical protein
MTEGAVNLTRVHCKHVWQCHNEPPPQLIHVNKIFLKSRLKKVKGDF